MKYAKGLAAIALSMAMLAGCSTASSTESSVQESQVSSVETSQSKSRLDEETTALLDTFHNAQEDLHNDVQILTDETSTDEEKDKAKKEFDEIYNRMYGEEDSMYDSLHASLDGDPLQASLDELKNQTSELNKAIHEANKDDEKKTELNAEGYMSSARDFEMEYRSALGLK